MNFTTSKKQLGPHFEVLNIYLQIPLNLPMGSLVIVIEKNITDGRMDRQTGQKDICLYPVGWSHSYLNYLFLTYLFHVFSINI